MKQTIFRTLVFSLFASSCVATAEPSPLLELVQQGAESLAHARQAHTMTQSSHSTRGEEISVDPEPQPWHGTGHEPGHTGDEVASDPEPQPWHVNGNESGHEPGHTGDEVAVDPEPQPWHNAVPKPRRAGEATPTTNPAANHEPVAATK